MTSNQLSLLGKTEPDPAGEILGTGYMRFQNPKGVGGLAKWTDERLDILAVHSMVEGKGMFKKFVHDAKSLWKTICVWHDWNPLIGEALAKYGFKREVEIDGRGEILEGWRWDAEDNSPTPPTTKRG